MPTCDLRKFLTSAPVVLAMMQGMAGLACGQLGVTAFHPAPNLLSVPTTAPIRIDFDRPIDRSLVDASRFAVFGRWSGAATGTFQFANNDQSVIFQPNRPFSAGEVVTVNLANDLRATDNSALPQGGYSAQFWTASQRVEDIQYTELQTYSTGNPSRPYGGIATDLNGDGWLDVTTVNEDSADLRVFMNRALGDGAFEDFNQVSYPVGNRASPSESADFNRDGFADITTANINDDTISVLLGNGDGTFAPQQTIPVGDHPRGVAVLDVDGDNDWDIVNTNRFSSSLSLHINNGNGVFGTPSVINSSLVGEWSLMAADMNGDGVSDLVVGSGNTQQVQVLTGNGDGTFTEQPLQQNGGLSWQIALGDVNGDGIVDMASANAQSNNGSIFLGVGDGTFLPAVTYDIVGLGSGSNGFPLATDLGDLDGDGDLDWITSSFNGEFVVQLNDGNGNFSYFSELDAPVAASCTLMFDFDNDGDLDLALFDELDNTITFNRNDGVHVASGDFDANGQLDLADIDALVMALAEMTYLPQFDLSGDGYLDQNDLTLWLALGGAANLPNGNPFLVGDANLDGVVDGQDFLVWNANKFTNSPQWSTGDFNHDGVVDGQDFLVWNVTKFTQSAPSVPEPHGWAMVAIGAVLLVRGRTRVPC